MHDGQTQQVSFRELELAEKAKTFIEYRRNRVTADEVNDEVLGTNNVALTAAATSPEAKPKETVREWADIYLASKTRLGPDTRYRYEQQLRDEILPALGHLRLDQVDGVAVAKFLNDLRSCDCTPLMRGARCSRSRNKEHGLDDRTATRYYSLLHAMFAFAVKENRIPDNPAKRTDWVRDMIAHDDDEEEGGDHVYLDEWEFALIYQHLAEDARPLIDFLIGTGARWGEATAILVRAVDVMSKPPVVKIHRAWKRDRKNKAWYAGTTKGRRKRTIDIPDELKETCIPLVAHETPDSLLFRNSQGGRIDHTNFVRRRWEPAVTAAMRCPLHPPAAEGRETESLNLTGPRCGDNGGLRKGEPCKSYVQRGWDRCKDHKGVPANAVSSCDCPNVLRRRPTLHDLRHTHAAWCIKAGEVLIAVSKRLGHSSIVITETTYAGILPMVNAKIVETINGLMSATRSALRALPPIESPAPAQLREGQPRQPAA